MTALEHLRDVCRGSCELAAGVAAWLGRGLSQWLDASGETTLDQALGIERRQGYRYTDLHRIARLKKSLLVAMPDLRGSSPRAKGRDLEDIITGRAPAASARVEEHLPIFREAGMPRTARRLSVWIAELEKDGKSLCSTPPTNHRSTGG